jgi:predicted secreted protein
MAKRFTNDMLLWVRRSGVFYPVLGQQNLGHSGSTATIDLSDKTTGGYGTEGPGVTSMQITLEVTPDLPDVNGYEYVESLFTSKTAEVYQIRKGGLAGNGTTDVQFECSMYVLNKSKTAPKNGVLSVSLTFGLAAAPTIDRTT